MNEVAVSGQTSSAALKTGISVETYPNPFNDVTTIELKPTESGEATLEVYDLTGYLVQRLFSGQLEAGRFRKFTLNGRTLSAGIYIVWLTTKNKSITQKIMLVK